MKQKKKTGRPPKIDTMTFRCSVNFNADEEAALMTMHEQSGVSSFSAFIKMQLFGKTFKVHHIDDNIRIFIDKLSSFNSKYRTIGIEYRAIVKILKEHFTEKKALASLYKLEYLTIDLVKLNRQIVALANDFNGYWRKEDSIGMETNNGLS